MAQNVPINATKHTMDVVKEVAGTDGISLAELVDSLDMPKSTVYDYVQTLLELEYLVHDEDGYKVGSKFLELGGQRRLNREVYRTAKPELKRLADETGEHVTLVIEEHGMGILLETMMGSNAVKVVAHDGTRTFLHTTAPGKAIMAHMPRERVEEILDNYDNDGLPAFASETNSTKSRN